MYGFNCTPSLICLVHKIELVNGWTAFMIYLPTTPRLKDENTSYIGTVCID